MRFHNKPCDAQHVLGAGSKAGTVFYRDLVRRCHPDKIQDEHERQLAATSIREVLDNASAIKALGSDLFEQALSEPSSESTGESSPESSTPSSPSTSTRGRSPARARPEPTRPPSPVRTSPKPTRPPSPVRASPKPARYPSPAKTSPKPTRSQSTSRQSEGAPAPPEKSDRASRAQKVLRQFRMRPRVATPVRLKDLLSSQGLSERDLQT